MSKLIIKKFDLTVNGKLKEKSKENWVSFSKKEKKKK